MAQLLAARYHFLSNYGGNWFSARKTNCIKDVITELESLSHNHQPLALLERKVHMYLATKKIEFKGKHLFMKRSVEIN